MPEGGPYHDRDDCPASFISSLLPRVVTPPRALCRVGGGALLAFLFLGQAACGARCEGERRRTGEALEKARAAQAERYAPDVYQMAANLSDQADAECRAQEDRFFPMRSYSRSRKLHGEARREAEKAAREGRVNEGMARQEALNARYVAVQAVEGARAALVRAQKAKGDASVQDLADVLVQLRRALAELQDRLDRGESLPARELGDRIVAESIRLEAAANRRTLGIPAPPAGGDKLY